MGRQPGGRRGPQAVEGGPLSGSRHRPGPGRPADAPAGDRRGQPSATPSVHYRRWSRRAAGSRRCEPQLPRRAARCLVGHRLDLRADSDRDGLRVLHRRRVLPPHRRLACRCEHAHRHGPRRTRDGATRTRRPPPDRAGRPLRCPTDRPRRGWKPRQRASTRPWAVHVRTASRCLGFAPARTSRALRRQDELAAVDRPSAIGNTAAEVPETPTDGTRPILAAQRRSTRPNAPVEDPRSVSRNSCSTTRAPRGRKARRLRPDPRTERHDRTTLSTPAKAGVERQLGTSLPGRRGLGPLAVAIRCASVRVMEVVAGPRQQVPRQ